MWKIWNWNVLTYEMFISHTKWEYFHMWNEQVQNFTCEILAYETCISHMKWNLRIWNCHFTYGIETIHVCEITYEIFVRDEKQRNSSGLTGLACWEESKGTAWILPFDFLSAYVMRGALWRCTSSLSSCIESDFLILSGHFYFGSEQFARRNGDPREEEYYSKVKIWLSQQRKEV